MSSSPFNPNSSATTLVAAPTPTPMTGTRRSSHFSEKNYALALASLQSSYGASGHAPVLPPRDSFSILKASAPRGLEPDSSELPPLKSTSSRQPRWKSLLFRARRGSSDVVKHTPPKEVETSEDRTRASLSSAEHERTSRSSSSSDQKKDFTAAFANLQSSYGIGAPVVAGTSH